MTERLAEWSRLIDGLEADGAVPTAILDSWQRSRDAGVERDEPKFHRVPDEELRARLASNAAWLAIAEPHLEWLTKAFKHIPHVVYVTDRDGIVLSSAGSDSLIARFALFPGYDWSEATMGTNGAGTALVANQPVAVVGPQHLVRQFDDCTCTGAPSAAMPRRRCGRARSVTGPSSSPSTRGSACSRESKAGWASRWTSAMSKPIPPSWCSPGSRTSSAGRSARSPGRVRSVDRCLRVRAQERQG